MSHMQLTATSLESNSSVTLSQILELASSDLEYPILRPKVVSNVYRLIEGCIKDNNGAQSNYEMIFAADGPSSK